MAEIRDRTFQAPPEVTRYLADKALRPAFHWQDVWAEEHAHAFTVAKATELELLTSFKRSIEGALAEGASFETWREKIRADLTRQGWWRPRMVKDPSGRLPDREVNFSSDRRLKTIFWSNMNSARSAGQWERAQRTKKVLPYILYVRTTALDPRQEHLRWAGTILPVDDPFWHTHWPPNGWGCKCTVRQIGAPERERLLLNAIQRADGVYYTDTAPPVTTRAYRNKRTGEITQVPEGIDPGWSGNPGRDRATTLLQHLEERLAAADPTDATRALTQLWTDPYVRIAPKLRPKAWLPAGVSERLAKELKATTPVISVTGEDIAARQDRHKMKIDDFALLPEIIEKAIVLADPLGKPHVRSLLHRIGKTWWRAFVTVSENGYLRVTSLHQRQERMVRAELQRAGLSIDKEK